MSNDNKKEGVNKIGINWASHIYAKPVLTPYKIRKLEKLVFTHYK